MIASSLTAIRLGQTFDHAQRRAVQVGLHDLHQGVVAQLGDGREALGQDLAVAAVRAEDEIVGRQVEGHADRRRFLADREVGRAAVVVLDAFVDAFLLDAVEHGLELADGDHVAVDAHQVVRAILLGLGLRVGHVGVDRNLGRAQHAGLASFGGVDGD